jgi:hypothetical protein
MSEEERSKQAFPGIPSLPPPDVEFTDSVDDEHCPHCEWDASDVFMDRHDAHSKGILLAIELEDTPIFGSMAGLIMMAYYLRCPQCEGFFTIEDETHTGAMA